MTLFGLIVVALGIAENEDGIDVEALYRRYGPMVLRRCRFLLRDEESALDAMQETFIKVIESKKRLNAKYPSSLLYTIATNVCLNIIRSNKRHSTYSNDDIIAQIAFADTLEVRLEANEILDKIFKNEKTSTKAIAVMHYVDKMTYKEIAKEIGLSVSGVRKRLRLLSIRAKERSEI